MLDDEVVPEDFCATMSAKVDRFDVFLSMGFGIRMLHVGVVISPIRPRSFVPR